tara:strand:- start:48929 stop:49126 length:198 start_codon:yes stop_codon:yes gene_type:complete
MPATFRGLSVKTSSAPFAASYRELVNGWIPLNRGSFTIFSDFARNVDAGRIFFRIPAKIGEERHD